MKKIILYCSKHGGAKHIAQELGKACNEYEIQELNENINIENYDVIVLGSGVYAGLLDKKCKTFVSKNKEQLKQKKVLFYISGISIDTKDKEIQENFDEDFVLSLKYSDKLGGQINFPNLNFFEKAIMKMIIKKDKKIANVDTKSCVTLFEEKRIENFIEVMKQA